MAEPKIIMRMKFTSPKQGAGFYDYLERKEAVSMQQNINVNKTLKDRNESRYFDYMDRSRATTLEEKIQTYNQNVKKDNQLLPTFNDVTNHITNKDKKNAQKKLAVAEKNKANFWSIVLSFSDECLKENDLINNKGILDQEQLKNCVRTGMKKFLKENNFDEQAFWLADVHFNTKHIHVHIALSELKPTRRKKVIDDKIVSNGNFLKRNIRSGKQIFYHSLENQENRNNEINLLKKIDQVQTLIIGNTRNTNNIKEIERQVKTSKTDTLVHQLYLQLPSNKNHWRYGSNAYDMKAAKTTLNQLIDNELENSPEYDQFINLVKTQAKHSRETYGENITKDILKTKEKRLKSVIGNHFLKEMKTIIEDRPEDIDKIKINQTLEKSVKNMTPEKIIKEILPIHQKALIELNKQRNTLETPIEERSRYRKLKSEIKLVSTAKRVIAQANYQENSKIYDAGLKNIQKTLSSSVMGTISREKLQEQQKTLAEKKQLEHYLTSYGQEKIKLVKGLSLYQKKKLQVNKLMYLDLSNGIPQRILNDPTKLKYVTSGVDIEIKMLQEMDMKIHNIVYPANTLNKTSFNKFKHQQLKYLNTRKEMISLIIKQNDNQKEIKQLYQQVKHDKGDTTRLKSDYKRLIVANKANAKIKQGQLKIQQQLSKLAIKAPAPIGFYKKYYEINKNSAPTQRVKTKENWELKDKINSLQINQQQAKNNIQRMRSKLKASVREGIVASRTNTYENESKVELQKEVMENEKAEIEVNRQTEHTMEEQER